MIVKVLLLLKLRIIVQHQAMASFEERLPTVIGPSGVLVKDSGVVDSDSSSQLKYYARPENYQGSNIHSIRRFIYAKQEDAPQANNHDSKPQSTRIESTKLRTDVSTTSRSSRNSVWVGIAYIYLVCNQ